MYTVQNMQLFKGNSNCTETLPTLFKWFLPLSNILQILLYPMNQCINP